MKIHKIRTHHAVTQAVYTQSNFRISCDKGYPQIVLHTI